MQLNAAPRVTWLGRFRPPLADCRDLAASGAGGIADLGRHRRQSGERGERRAPRPAADARQHLAAAGLARAAGRRLQAHRRARRGTIRQKLRVALAGHMHIGETPEEARDEFYPYYSNYFRLHAPKTSYAREVPREELRQARRTADGPLFVGSPRRSSTRCSGSGSCSATSATSRRSTSAACHSRRWRGRSSCSAEKVLPAVRGM